MKKVLMVLILNLVLMSNTALSAKAGIWDFTKKTVAITLGTPVNVALSIPRGLITGMREGKDTVTENMENEDGFLEQTTGFLFGAPLGGAFGALGGAYRGFNDGIHYGLNEPLSGNNFGFSGDNLFDYNPFDLDN